MVIDIDNHGGDGILWYIDKNATNLASGAFADGGSQDFRSGAGGIGLGDISVSRGDFLYFAIHPRSNYLFDSTKLDISISAINANSVSGQVTDGGGQPFAGVTISSGSAGTATTDSNGAYTISGLAAGTHTLTPSKSGYTFSPASRTVTVPPDAVGQDFTGVVALQGLLALRPLYPAIADQPSRIQRGGVAHRYFEVRDAAGALAPSVTVTFAPTGSGTSNNNGLLDVAVTADSLSIQASHLLTAVSASRWDQNYALAAPVSFVVETSERPFEHHWYGGTVRKLKGGISAGLVAFLEGKVKGGLEWTLSLPDTGGYPKLSTP